MAASLAIWACRPACSAWSASWEIVARSWSLARATNCPTDRNSAMSAGTPRSATLAASFMAGPPAARSCITRARSSTAAASYRPCSRNFFKFSGVPCSAAVACSLTLTPPVATSWNASTRRSCSRGACQPSLRKVRSSPWEPFSALAAASRTPAPPRLKTWNVETRSSWYSARSASTSRKRLTSSSVPVSAVSAAAFTPGPPCSQRLTTRLRSVSVGALGPGPGSVANAGAVPSRPAVRTTGSRPAHIRPRTDARVLRCRVLPVARGAVADRMGWFTINPPK